MLATYLGDATMPSTEEPGIVTLFRNPPTSVTSNLRRDETPRVTFGACDVRDWKKRPAGVAVEMEKKHNARMGNPLASTNCVMSKKKMLLGHVLPFELQNSFFWTSQKDQFATKTLCFSENDVMRVWFLRVFVICGFLCFF